MMHSSRKYGILLAIAALAAIAFIVLSPPAEQRGLLIPCFFHKATGLYCPGCGTTRGVWKLAHGDLIGALGSNIMLPFILGFTGYELTRSLAKNIFGKNIPPIKFSNKAIIAFIIISLSFMVVRNIPVEPFCRLAP